jgi:protein SCO1/2
LWSVPVAADGARWGADYFPNVTLTTHEGKTVHFYDDLIKGKIVAIDLIYTTCQYACPLETARLAQVQRVLGDRVGRDIFFYSITIDPDHDTPQVLKEYAEKYHVGPGWLFLTGKASDIELISKRLGLYSEPNAANPDGHTPYLLIGNETTGQWMRNSALDNPRFLATTIGEWLNNWRTAQAPAKSYTDVPTLTFDRGEYTFKSHCAACHTVGGGDRIGPDLRGVTASRDPNWLARYIVQPDKVLAEGDPIAQALFAKYKQVRMPNLALSPGDAAALMQYIAAESGDAPTTSGAAASAPMPPMAGMPETGPARSAPSAGKTERTAASRAPQPADLKAVIEPYLRIHEALAADTLDGVMANAAKIATEAVKIGSGAVTIRTAVNPFAQATDLARARDAFGPLGDAIIEYARRAGLPLGDGVNVAYCPMARKHWLQKGETIQNPFYGKQMAECGRIVSDAPPTEK